MTRIVIVGAGGFGRELHGWITTSPVWAARNQVDEVVFIDDHEPQVPVRAPVLSTIDAYRPKAGDLAVCAIGVPATRRAVVDRVHEVGGEFSTFIHDSVIVGQSVVVGEGAIICPRAILSSDIVVGDHVHINTMCTIGHDARIHEFATFSSACNLAGNVTIGASAFLGTAVTVIPSRTIGENAYVGAGSVVVRNVKPNTTVFGNPSVKIGDR